MLSSEWYVLLSQSYFGELRLQNLTCLRLATVEAGLQSSPLRPGPMLCFNRSF